MIVNESEFEVLVGENVVITGVYAEEKVICYVQVASWGGLSSLVYLIVTVLEVATLLGGTLHVRVVDVKGYLILHSLSAPIKTVTKAIELVSNPLPFKVISWPPNEI